MSVVSRVAEPSDVPTPAELDPELGFRLAGWITILIVEDDQRVRAMARRVLAGQAYRVLEAVNGADAIRVVEQANERIDLVLTDVEMPTIGVRSMLRRLKAENPELRVIVMSGYSDPELLARGFDIGNDPFLSKPFTGLALVAAVRQMVHSSSAPQTAS
jgi:two-component system cell cycle sensor histidine kinase/response regulator CckA